MSQEARLRIAKARDFLAQMCGLDPTDRGETIVHQAYYAMFHAALAVLTAAGAEPASKHASVIAAFGRLVRDKGDQGRAQGRALNRAFDLRMAADYAVGRSLLPETVAETAASAIRFVEFCEETLKAGPSERL